MGLTTDVERAHGGREDLRRYTRAIVVSGVLSTIAYVAVLWDYAIAPFRTALAGGAFSNFYDIQARALLRGHLDVPRGSLGIEGFVVRGKELTYFPPGPSLLRMPVFALTHRFDGRVTALSMLLAWVTATVLIALLMWRVRHLMRGGAAPLGRWEAVGYGLLLAASTCGSVLLFLGSLPWVYHEAYAWAVPMAIGTAHCLLGLIERPTPRRIVAAGLFTLGAMLSRTTTGWACVGALVLTSLWFWRGRRGGEARRRWWLVTCAGLVPLAVGVGLNWVKFRHPYLFPLEDQLWTKVSPHRRAALAANGGDLISLKILPSTIVNYFRPNGLRFISLLPFITLPATVAQSYGGGYLDQTYRTGSVTDFMPALFVLGAWGLITAFRRRAPDGTVALRPALLGLLAIPGGIMFYGYIAYRYTSEFLPLLVLAATVGFTDVARRLAVRPRRARLGALGVIAVLTAFGLVANAAAALTTQREAFPGPRLRDYVIYQEKLSSRLGNPIDGYVKVSEELPPGGRADELRIVGRCDALYLGTGEPLAPWVVVEARELAAEVTVVPDVELAASLQPLGEIELAEFDGHERAPLLLQRSGRDRFRLSIGDGKGSIRSLWFDAPVGSRFAVRVRTDTQGGRFVAEVVGNDPVGIDLAMAQFDAQLFALPNVMRPIVPDATGALAEGLRVRRLETPPLSWCERLLARHDG